MNILLTRKVLINVYEVIMEIGQQTQREDLLSILKLAEHLNRPLKPLDICENFFPEKPESIGEAILVRCKNLDLLNNDFKLTNIGYEALNDSKVFLKEEHCYLLWITREFLYPEKFLDIKPLKFNEEQMKLNYFLNQKDSENNNQIINTPEDITEFEGKVFTLPNSNNKIIFYNIDKKLKMLELKEKRDLRVFLEIKNILDEPSFSINFSGFINKKIEHKPEINYEEIWLSLLGDFKRDWDPNKKALKVRYSQINDAEKSIFRKNIKFNDPVIPNLGKFDSTEVNDVPIIPKSNEDAQLWAEWLMIDRINNYIPRRQFEIIKNDINLLFEDYDIILPSMIKLAKRVLELNENKKEIYPKKYWFLQTPLDLNPSFNE